MFGNNFIAFQRTKGVYIGAIKEYRSWYEVSDMSPLIEVGGESYRILRTTGFMQKKFPRKMIVCKKNGQVEKSEEITRKCFRVYLYLCYFEFNKGQMSSDISQGGERRHEPLIEAFKTMIKELKGNLTNKELKAMEFHLFYLEEVYRLSTLIAEAAETLLVYRDQLDDLNGDKLSTAFIKQIINMVQVWEELRYKLEAILLEDKKVRDTVLKVLQNPTNKKEISNKKFINNIIHDIHGAKDATRRTIAKVKKEKHNYEDTNEFSLERYIYTLRNEKTVKGVIQRNMKVLMKENWVLSSECFYKW